MSTEQQPRTLQNIVDELNTAITSKNVELTSRVLNELMNVKYTLADANSAPQEAKNLLNVERFSTFGSLASGDIADNALRYAIDVLSQSSDASSNTGAIDNLKKVMKAKLHARKWMKIRFDGELGDRLFQLAALLGTSVKLGFTPVLDPTMWSSIKVCENDHAAEDAYLDQLVSGLPHVSIANINAFNNVVLNENSDSARRYLNIAIDDKSGDEIFNIIMNGKFQAQDYFCKDENVCKDVRKRFTPSDAYLASIRVKYNLGKNTAFIYSASSVEQHRRDTFVKLLPSSATSIEFVEIGDHIPPLEQLAIMISCPYGGISDGRSLGWWGLWLNPSSTKMCFFDSNDLDLVKGIDFITPGIGVTSARKTKSYVINLDHRSDRYRRFLAQSSYANTDTILDVERFSASNGREIVENGWTSDVAHLFRYDQAYPRSNPYRNHNKNPGEIGCAMSHYRLWKKIAAECPSNDVVLVLEDDVQFGVNFCTRFEYLRDELVKRVNEFDVCFLGSTDDVDKYEDIPVAEVGTDDYNSRTLVKRFNPNPPTPRINGGGIFGYLLTRHGAQRYVDFTEKFGIPQAVDWFMFEMMKLNISLKCHPHLVHSPIYGTQTMDSDIQDPRKTLPVNKKSEETGGVIRFTQPIQKQLEDARPRIKVRPISNWSDSRELYGQWAKMSFDGKGVWGDKIKLVPDEQCDITCIVNHPGNNKITTPVDKCIIYHMEPKTFTERMGSVFSNPDPTKFLSVQTHKYANNNLEWHTSPTYEDYMYDRVDLTKTRGDKTISTIVSNLYQYTGHKLRLDFLRQLQIVLRHEKSDIQLDIWGRSKDVFGDGHMGELPLFKKDGGLHGYKYTFAAENFTERNYITEKFVDAILSECLCFYWGCPNYSDYFPKDCVVWIPIDKSFEECYSIIKSTIANNEWEKRLPVIRRAKFELLNRRSFFPVLASLVTTTSERLVYYSSSVDDAKMAYEKGDYTSAQKHIIAAASCGFELSSSFLELCRLIGAKCNNKLLTSV